MRIDSSTSWSALSGLDSPPPAAAASATPKDEFLRLLVAQLQHQNPLSPQDGAQFVAQLAQFTAIEQGAEANKRLGDIQVSQGSLVRAGYSNLVGKTVNAKAGTISLPAADGQGPEMFAHVGSAASKVEVIVKDSSGKEVKRIALGPQGEGDVRFAWDGTDENGVRMPEGSYTVEVKATTAQGGEISAYAGIRGVVSAVDFQQGSVRFRVGGMTISPADILAIQA